MPRARATGSSKVTRTEETKRWKSAWEAVRATRRAESASDISDFTAGKCDGYAYLFTISARLGPDLEVLSEALTILQTLKLDGPDWRRNLERLERMGGGDTHDNFAFGVMHYLVVGLEWTSEKRAAEYAVATMGLYPASQSWNSAVTRCRAVWQSFRKGAFTPLGDVLDPKEIFVRPRLDNLRENEMRRIVDPRDMSLLPKDGKLVANNSFWQSMIALNVVEVLQTD